MSYPVALSGCRRPSVVSPRMPGQPHVGPAGEADSLLLLTAQGDREAFARLYDQLAPAVFGLVKRVMRDPTISEEVTQEVMLEVWRQAPRFDPAVASATAFVLTIAHRRAVDRVRSEQAHRARTEAVGVRNLEVAHDPVPERLERAWERSAVRQALGGLSDLQRQAIELAYYGGMTQRQIAAELGVPLGTVKTRIRDGMSRLAGMLGHAR